jgi:hypothetical protein
LKRAQATWIVLGAATVSSVVGIVVLVPVL